MNVIYINQTYSAENICNIVVDVEMLSDIETEVIIVRYVLQRAENTDNIVLNMYWKRESDIITL